MKLGYGEVLPGVKIIPSEQVKRFVVTQAPKRAAVITGKD
jgi:hypothetical protein